MRFKLASCLFLFSSLVIAQEQTPEKKLRTLEEEIAQFDKEFDAVSDTEALEMCNFITLIKPVLKQKCVEEPEEECKVAVPLLDHVTKRCVDRATQIQAKEKAKKT